MGEEVTEALPAEFPARDGDQLVTKEFLRAELAELRAELHGGLAGVQSRVTGTLIGAMAVATTVILAFGRRPSATRSRTVTISDQRPLWGWRGARNLRAGH